MAEKLTDEELTEALHFMQCFNGGSTHLVMRMFDEHASMAKRIAELESDRPVPLGGGRFWIPNDGGLVIGPFREGEDPTQPKEEGP